MKDEIVRTIEGVIRERFSDTTIVSIVVTEDSDFDGEPVFMIRVVFDSKTPLDAHKTAGIVRHIRHKLLEMEEEAFPIMAFVSKAEIPVLTSQGLAQ